MSGCGCSPAWRRPRSNGTCGTCGWLPGEAPPSLTAMWGRPVEDEWVAVAHAPVSNPATGFSVVAGRFGLALMDVGVQSRERPWPQPGPDERPRVAVLVRRRDSQAAQARLAEIRDEGEWPDGDTC